MLRFVGLIGYKVKYGYNDSHISINRNFLNTKVPLCQVLSTAQNIVILEIKGLQVSVSLYIYPETTHKGSILPIHLISLANSINDLDSVRHTIFVVTV